MDEMTATLIIALIIIGFIWLIKSGPKREQIVAIYFCYVPHDAIFRYDYDWWLKKSHKSAISSKGAEKIIPSLSPVGALLQDLPYENHKYILNDD